MTSRREFYRRAEATWPAEVPELTGPEAIRAARKLYRFVHRRAYGRPVWETSGRRYSGYSFRREPGTATGRQGGIAVNPGRGWYALVHELSHAFGGGHSKDHARLEARMIREVLKRGWLAGALKDKPKPAAAAPTPAQVIDAEVARAAASLKRWQTKAKRAQTAIKKLTRKLARLERRRAQEAA